MQCLLKIKILLLQIRCYSEMQDGILTATQRLAEALLEISQIHILIEDTCRSKISLTLLECIDHTVIKCLAQIITPVMQDDTEAFRVEVSNVL